MIKNNKKNKNIFIIDFMSFSCRFFFAQKNIIRRPILYNIFKLIKYLKNNYENLYICIALDSKNNFRKDIDNNYKKNRKKLPDELFKEIELFFELNNIINLRLFTKETYEADDVIASLVEKYNKNKKNSQNNIHIISYDKDLITILREGIFLCKFSNNQILKYSSINIKEKRNFNFNLSEFDLFLSLRGDSSDNIKGIKSIGKIAATKILNLFKKKDNFFYFLSNLDNEYKKNELKNKLNLNKTQIKNLIEKDCIIRLKHNLKLVQLKRNLYLEENLKLSEIDNTFIDKILFIENEYNLYDF